MKQLNRLTPAERRRLLLARISHQRGRVEFHHGAWTLMYWQRDISAPRGWRQKRERLEAESRGAALIEADKFLTKVNETNQPGRRSGRIPTLQEFKDGEWKRYLERRERSVSTLASYDSNLRRYILPILGEKRISQITPKDISEVLESGGVGKEGKSLLNLYALLRVMFDVAYQHDLISETPVRPKIHRPTTHQKEKPALTANETWQVLATVEPEYRLIFVVAALTGYRAGELLGLQWSNVNTEKGYIKATHKIWNGKRISKLKTEKSGKPIRIARDLVVMLNEWQEASSFDQASDYMFCRSDGRPYDPQWLLKNVWYPALRKCKIEPGPRTHGFHLLRHSAGTILAELTRDMVLVRDFLRHTEIQTTSGYLHLSEDAADHASEQLADAILRKVN